MDAQELLVHNSGQWQSTEGFHARIVYTFRILVLAYAVLSMEFTEKGPENTHSSLKVK